MTLFVTLLLCAINGCDSDIVNVEAVDTTSDVRTQTDKSAQHRDISLEPRKKGKGHNDTTTVDTGDDGSGGTATDTTTVGTGDGGTGGTATDTTTVGGGGTGGTTTDTTSVGGGDTGSDGGTAADTTTATGGGTGTGGGTPTDTTTVGGTGGTGTGGTGGTGGTTGGTGTGTTGGTGGTGGTTGGTGTGTTGGTGGTGGTDTGSATATPGGIWMTAAEIAARPTSGTAWSALKAEADKDCGTPNLSDQEQRNNVCVMAKALVFARIGGAAYRDGVLRAIQSIVSSGTYDGRALALGRELGAYVIAADLIGLSTVSPALDSNFRAKLRELRDVTTTEAGTLIQCNERRPNNWGTHCGGSRAAVAAYLNDTAELDRVARVFRGWLGDRSQYAGFSYGDLSWQCNSAAPVGINPSGCNKDGHDIGGVLPDDQRRGGSFTWPAPKENYVYEALQGALLQAVILSRRGYDVWNWSDKALLRAYTWLYQVNGFAAEGDDTWQMHIVNHYYGTSFSAQSPTQPGKNIGWTDWSHR